MYDPNETRDDYTTTEMDIHIRADKMVAVAQEYLEIGGYRRWPSTMQSRLENDREIWLQEIEEAGELSYDVAVHIVRTTLEAMNYGFLEDEDMPESHGLVVVELRGNDSELNFDKATNYDLWSVLARHEAVESTVSIALVPHIQYFDLIKAEGDIDNPKGLAERWAFARGNIYENHTLLDHNSYPH